MFLNTLLGLCGIVLYTLSTAGITFGNKGFDALTMLRNNGVVWGISTAVILFTAAAFEYSPQAVEFITSFLKGQFGVDFADYSKNYLTFGFALTPIVKAWQNRTQNK